MMRKWVSLSLLISLMAVLGSFPVLILAQSNEPPYEPITPENVGDLEEVGTLGRGRITSVAWSPDGGSIAAASETGLWLYPPSGELAVPQRIAADTVKILRTTFTSDGLNLLTFNQEGRVQIWDTQDYQKPPRVIELGSEFRFVVLNQDGKSVIAVPSGSLDTIALYDISQSTMPIGQLKVPAEMILAVDLSPDGHLIAALSSDGVTRVWDAATFRLKFRLKISYPKLLGWPRKQIAFSPDGSILAIIGIDQAGLYDVRTGKIISTIPYMQGDELRFSPDGKLLFAGDAFYSSPGVELWDVSTPQRPEEVWGACCVSSTHTLLDNMSAAFSPDGNHLVVAGVGDVWVVNTKDELPFPPYDGHARKIRFNGIGTKLATVAPSYIDPRTNGVVIWDMRTGEEIPTLLTKIWDAGFAGDEKVVAVDYNGTLYWWNTSTNRLEIQLATEFSERQCCIDESAFSPDGSLVVIQDEDRTALLDTTTGKRLAIMTRNEDDYFNDYRFSDDGQYIATFASGTYASWEEPVRLWNVAKLIHDGHMNSRDALTPISRYGFTHAVAIHNENQLATSLVVEGAAIYGAMTQTWDSSISPNVPFGISDSGYGSPAADLAYSLDGRLLMAGKISPATLGRGEFTVYDIQRGIPVASFDYRSGATSVAITSDSKMIAVSTADGQIHLYAVPPAQDTD